MTYKQIFEKITISQNNYKKKKTLDFISKFVKKTTIIHNNANIIKHFDN